MSVPPNRHPHLRRPSGPPWDPLAIVAFVLAILGVCPPIGFFAMILGCIANWRLVGRTKPRRGRGLALWAIGIGSGTTIAWMLLWSAAQERVTDILEARIESRIELVLLESDTGNTAAIRAQFDPTSRPTDESIAKFADELKALDLNVRGISVSNFAYLTGGLVSRSRADLRVELADGRPWTGSVTMVQRPVASQSPSLGDLLSLETIVSQPMLLEIGLIGPSGRRLDLVGTASSPNGQSDYTADESTTP